MRSFLKLYSRLTRDRRSSDKPMTASRKTTPRLRMETLEGRDLPSITIQLDYSYDTSGMFNNTTAREVMAYVADELGDSLNANLAAIAPSGGNTWAAFFSDPSTGSTAQVSNLAINADTIKVYVGARDLPGNGLGEGGPGISSAIGDQPWQDTVATRNHFGFSPWGGSIAFDSLTNWYYGSPPLRPGADQYSLYSVALHEMGHVLGIGTSSQWFQHSDLSNSLYRGFNAANLYGGPVPLETGGQHWNQSLGTNGPNLVPGLLPGRRVDFSPLDYAALSDLGWEAIAPNPLVVKSVTVGTATYTLDSEGNVYRTESGGGSPMPSFLMTTNAHQIGSAEGRFYALTTGGALLKYSSVTGGMVTELGGIVQMGPGQGRFFALRNDGVLLRFNAVTGSFDITVASGGIDQIGSGQGQLFAHQANGSLLRYNDSTGTLDIVFSGGIIQLASAQPEIFILRYDGALFHYNGTTGAFDAELSGVTDIAVSGYRLLLLRNDGAVLRYNPYTTGVYDTLIPGGITQIAAAQGRFLVLDTNGVVSRYNIDSDGFDVTTTNVTQIASGQGRIFALDNLGNVYRYGAPTNSFNFLLTTNVTQIASNQGRFFVLTNTGVVDRYDAATGTFTAVLTNVFRIGTGQGRIFALDNLGNLYRYGAGAGVFNLAGSGAISIASARGQFFLLDGAGVVYRYNGSTGVGSYDVSYPGNVAAIGTIDGDFYILRNDNVLLKYDPNTGGYVLA